MAYELTLDEWQKEVLETDGNICLRSGRQVGKSTIIGIKAAQYAMKNKNKVIMIIAKVERQAGLLFEKILANVHYHNKNAIKTGKFRPTKSKLQLKNGSIIHCLPAGDTGYGIMGFTIDLLIADEAAFIPEEVWNSIIPALAVTKGNVWLLSTPFIKEGYYYNCFKDPSFTSFHQSSEDCPRKDIEFLKHKKETLTKAQYAQMYLGEFVDEFQRVFSEAWIKKVCTGKRRKQLLRNRDYFIGCDVARKDKDEFTFEIVDRTNRDKIEQVESILTIDKPIPESARKIIALNLQYNFIKEYIDSGGMGITVCDILRENDNNKRKVVEINNSSRRYVEDGEEKKKGILKEDLYENLVMLGEQGKIILLDDDEIKASLMSVQFEIINKKAIYSGDYTHIAEGLVRAAWCSKDKSLKPYIC